MKYYLSPKFYLFILSLLFILCLVFLSGCNADSNDNTESISSYEDTDFAMGTVVNQTIYSEDKKLADEVIDLLKTTENRWISWRAEDSEVAAINKNAELSNPTVVTDETKGYLTSAMLIAKKSSGAFDPTIGMLTRLWDFDNGKNVVPSDEDIKNTLESVGYKNINIEGNTLNLNKNTSIDLGAIGKGIGCDEIEKYLNKKGDVTGALFNIGGSSILTYGNKPSSAPWKVAILNPRGEDYLGYIEVEGTHHISTSGDYEKYFEENGKRYHHILDPSTGYPADNELMSVTIMSDHGANSDGLSTACFVLGEKKALKLLEEYDADGIFVDKDKNVYITEGLKDKFTLTANEYKLI